MKMGRAALGGLVLLVASGGSLDRAAADAAAIERGARVFHAGGCLACHTDPKAGIEPLAGGPPLETPFGTFYGPNITPDLEHGIGRWTEADFIRALKDGISPDGAHYYPAFPYTSFTKANEADLKDLWAYILAQPPVARPSRPHDLPFPFRWRATLIVWKWLNFEPAAFVPDPTRDAAWNRGAYLVEALSHCAECHTRRNWLGGLDSALHMAGTQDGPDGDSVPNITPDKETGIGDWSASDIAFLLKTGFLPDGDVVGASMADVVNNGTSKLTDEDRKAIVVYLMALPPIRHDIVRKPAE